RQPRLDVPFAEWKDRALSETHRVDQSDDAVAQARRIAPLNEHPITCDLQGVTLGNVGDAAAGFAKDDLFWRRPADIFSFAQSDLHPALHEVLEITAH